MSEVVRLPNENGLYDKDRQKVKQKAISENITVEILTWGCLFDYTKPYIFIIK